MSSTQSRTQTVHGDAQSTKAITFPFDNSILFPNSSTKPIRADFTIVLWRDYYFLIGGTSYAFIGYNGVEKNAFSNTSESKKTQSANNDTSAEVITHNSADTTIFLALAGNHAGFTARSDATVTLYFTRYDFSASAGANVTSASVSSSTGYDGDTIQYRCTLASGAEWQGWYKDGALYSSTKDLNVTVGGTDLALQARATMPVTTKTLSATYNGAQLQGFPMSVQADAPITYGGVSKGAVPFAGGAKTLKCAGKVCSGNIGIGGKTLQCANKLMATDIVCQIT